MNYKIIRNVEFEENLRNIVYFYYSKNNSKYADKLIKKIDEIVLSLNFFPKKFAIISEANNEEIRHFMYDRFRVLYRIDGKNIYIITIIENHGDIFFI